MIKGPKSAVFIAEDGGKVIGHIIVREESHFPIYFYDRDACVYEMFVAEGYRNMGIGTKLLKKAREWAKSRKLHFLSITIHTKNRKAFALYCKFGFREHHFEMRMVA